MFDTPAQPDDDHVGLWFTLLLYVYGSTLMASAYGTCLNLTQLTLTYRPQIQVENPLYQNKIRTTL